MLKHLNDKPRRAIVLSAIACAALLAAIGLLLRGAAPEPTLDLPPEVEQAINQANADAERTPLPAVVQDQAGQPAFSSQAVPIGSIKP